MTRTDRQCSKIWFVPLFAAVFTVFFGFAASAQDSTVYDLTKYNPLPSLKFSSLLCTGANWLISIGIVVVLIIIVYGGIVLLTSTGDESKRTRGKTILSGAVTGLAVLLLAKGIILIILGFLGLSLTSMTC